MRPKRLDLDAADALLTGFASNVTGAAFTLTANESGDSLAHRVSIRNDSATDHSGKTVTLVGTDADANPQTNVVTGPGNAATVESTKYFLTLTSATPSATIGADTFDIGWVDEFSSKTIVLNYDSLANPSAQVLVTGTIDFDLEVTLENPIKGGDEQVSPFTLDDQNDLAWENDANFTGKTASLMAQLAVPGIRGVRVVVNSYSSGAELQVWIVQAR
jgi:hypothetical protein